MTIGNPNPLESQLHSALVELRSLRQDVVALATRVLALERDHAPDGDAALPREIASAVRETRDADSVWSMLGESRLLPRVAITSFALVLALVLRTLADGAIIGADLGVLLGLGYAAVLIGLGAWLHAHDARGRRVLTACGVLLMCAVVLESRAGFATAPARHGVLLAMLGAGTAIGLRFRSVPAVAFAVLGASCTALALDFPHPSFPLAATVILAGNVAAALAQRIGRPEWLAWAQLLPTLGLWLMWGFQAHASHGLQGPAEHPLDLALFLPFAVAFAVLFVVLAVRRAAVDPSAPGAFAVVAPLVGSAMAYLAVAAARPPHADALPLAWAGCAAALLHFGIGAGLARRTHLANPVVSGFAVAGVSMCVLATPAVLGGVDRALPLWSALALGLQFASVRASGVALRGVALILQATVCMIALTAAELFAVPSDGPWTAAAASLAIVVFAALHYRSMRLHPAPATSWLARVDPGNHLPVVVLWIAAVAGFGVARILAWPLVESLAGDGAENAFMGAQSLIVNLACIGLMLWGLRAQRGEILATAVLVACYGGLRVVGSDLLGGHGVPLVLSVASFGAAAAVGSVVLHRWLARRTETHAQRDGSGLPSTTGSG